MKKIQLEITEGQDVRRLKCGATHAAVYECGLLCIERERGYINHVAEHRVRVQLKPYKERAK